MKYRYLLFTLCFFHGMATASGDTISLKPVEAQRISNINDFRAIAIGLSIAQAAQYTLPETEAKLAALVVIISGAGKFPTHYVVEASHKRNGKNLATKLSDTLQCITERLKERHPNALFALHGSEKSCEIDYTKSISQ